MTDDKKIKVLIIGSKDHPLADSCIEWQEDWKIPYLGDFHIVIINLQTLEKSLLGRTSIRDSFNKIRKQINEVIWANTSIFCITAPKIVYPIGTMEFSNYDWCPIDFNINNDFKGSEFNSEDLKEKKEDSYLRYVMSWSHYFETYDIKRYRLQYRRKVNIRFISNLRTLSNKFISFKIQLLEYNEGEYDIMEDVIYSRYLLFYPPTTSIEISKGIDILLEQLKGKKKEITLPPWTEPILLPGEKELLVSIEESETIIKQKLDYIEKEKIKLQKLQRLKGLFTEDGVVLEEIVEEAFRFLGIKLEKVEGNKEDRIFKFHEDIIPIEIKGRNASIPEKDLTQLIGRLGDIQPPKNLEARGVLIGNHYKDTPLNEKLEGRNKAFEPNVEEKAKTWNISLLSTLELFKAVRKKLEGEDIEETFFNRVFNQTGVIKID